MGLIHTGVDRLMSLINSRERMLVKDAAKELAVSEKLVMDWAEFLEEEGFLKFEYKFSKVFLIRKDLSEVDIKEKEKEYSSQKEAFRRKVQGLKQKIDRDSLGLEDVKKEFDNIYKEISDKKILIKDDLELLRKYEESKGDFDKQLNIQKEKYGLMIKHAENEVKKNYDEINLLLEKIKNEEQKLIDRNDELEEMKKVETQLKDYIHDSLDFLNKTMIKIDHTQKEISSTKSVLNSLRSDAAKLEKELKKYDDKIVIPLLNDMKKKEKSILSEQDNKFKELVTLEKSIKSVTVDSAAIEQRFVTLLNSKLKTVNVVEKLSDEKKELMKDLDELMNKINALTISTKGVSIADKVKKMKSFFIKVEAREKDFRQNVNELSGMLDKIEKKK